MKKNALSCLSVAVALLIPILAVAQTTSADNPAADPPAREWRITEKEVIAVQAELTRRGFYKSKITGVLDRNTREAVRAFQSNGGLKVTGRIDRATYETLELAYPATGKEADSLRRNGLLPKIGYGVKDTATSAGGAATGAAKKVGSGVRAGVDKTWEAGGATVSKSKEAVQGVPGVALKGAKSAGRGAERAGNMLIGRSDAEIHAEVRRTLEDNPETRYWHSEVKNGLVTVKTPPQSKADIGVVVSNIRKVAGVKSVFVIAQ
jgi:hypothetical protein